MWQEEKAAGGNALAMFFARADLWFSFLVVVGILYELLVNLAAKIKKSLEGKKAKRTLLTPVRSCDFNC